MILGEARAQLAKADAATAARIPDLREIVAFRNILVHGYAVVEHEIVWRCTRIFRTFAAFWASC